MSPVELLGFLAGGIGMFYGLPQARSIRAAGHGDGVSLAGWVLMLPILRHKGAMTYLAKRLASCPLEVALVNTVVDR